MTDPFSCFITGFVGKLKSEADNLNAYGASSCASTCSKIASDLESDFLSWRLTELTVSEAAKESGFSEDWIRKLVGEDKLPATKQGREYRIARCHLPQRTQPVVTDKVTSLEDRLLNPQSRDSRTTLRPTG